MTEEAKKTKKEAVKVYPAVRSDFMPRGGGHSLSLDTCDVSGKARIMRVRCTVPEGQENTQFILGNLPGGHTLFLGHLSYVEVSPVPEETDFWVGLGTYQEPMGERVKGDAAALVETRKMNQRQTLLGNLAKAKVRSVGAVDVILTTNKALPAGTTITGFLAFSSD